MRSSRNELAKIFYFQDQFLGGEAYFNKRYLSNAWNSSSQSPSASIAVSCSGHLGGP